MSASTAVTNLLQDSVCCAFIDALLHTLDVTSSCLSHSCLPVNLKQSGHSPPISDINKKFSSRELLITGYFSLLDHSL